MFNFLKKRASIIVQTKKTLVKKWDPAFYDENCTLQFNTSMEMLKQLRLNGDEIILDAGSGSGKITYQIAKKLPHGKIIGLDICKDMIDFASTHYLLNNLSFTQKSILDMNYHNHFDVVVSFWTLSWVDNQIRALRNMMNALKVGGQLFMMYPLRHDAYDIADLIIKKPVWASYFKEYSSPRPFFTEAQYRVIASSITEGAFNINKKELPCVFNSLDEMKLSIRSWMSLLDLLPNENEKSKFLDEFVELYLEKRSTIKPIMYFSVLEISAKKLSLTNELHGHLNLRAKL